MPIPTQVNWGGQAGGGATAQPATQTPASGGVPSQVDWSKNPIIQAHDNGDADQKTAVKESLVTQAKNIYEKVGGFLSKVAQTKQDVEVGFAKGAGRTVVDLYDLAGQVNKINPASIVAKKIGEKVAEKVPAVKKSQEKVDEVSTKVRSKVDEALKAKNTAQKIGGYIEGVAEVVVPEEKILGGASKIAKSISEGKSIKALALDTAELAKVNKNKLKFLSKEAMETTEMTKGIVKDKAYKMTEKVKELATEFKDVLKHSSVEKNLKSAQAAGKQYWHQTIDLLKQGEKVIPKKDFLSKIEKAVKDNAVYSTKTELKTLTKNATKAVMDKIKDAENITPAIVEKARAGWSAGIRKADARLSTANDAINTVLKDVVTEHLDDAGKKAYAAMKEKQAKLFDIREILRAKKAATEGAKSLIKKTAIVGGSIAGGAYAGYKGAQKYLGLGD